MGTKAGVLFAGAATVWALAAGGCVLDWTVPSGSGGGGGGGGADLVCKTSEACDCPADDVCDMSCTFADCSGTCGEGATCDLACSTASCDFVCANGATCDVACSGASCDIDCSEAAACTVTCPIDSSCTCVGGACECFGDGCA